MELEITRVRFPGLMNYLEDENKARNFFSFLFKKESPKIHRHFTTNGKTPQLYPLIQFKIISGTPNLIGLNKGGRQIASLFKRLKTLQLDKFEYILKHKNTVHITEEIGLDTKEHRYKFITPWMGLNQANYKNYSAATTPAERKAILERILTGNILSFFKSTGYYVEEQIEVDSKLTEVIIDVGDTKILAFNGMFATNAKLPRLVGIGKFAARGNGTIITIEQVNLPPVDILKKLEENQDS